MKTLVTYLSMTGNTQLIAETIFESVGGEKELKPLNEVKDLDGYDLTFVGFPVNMGGAPKPAIEFLQSKAKGKNVALFITHAMSAGAPPLKPILNNCLAAANDAKTVGIFHCQGELDRGLAEKLINAPDPMAREFAKTRPMTAGHPDYIDRASARRFAEEIIAKYDM